MQLGDTVDVAFVPQINEFRGERTVQLNVLDIRPSCLAECSPDTGAYHALCSGQLTAGAAAELYPDRATLALVWRYLAAPGTCLKETPICLQRKIVRWSGRPLSLGQLLTCLDVFQECKLLQLEKLRKNLSIRLTPGPEKADLTESPTLQQLLHAKEN